MKEDITCVLVCGSRDWTNKKRVFEVLDFVTGKEDRHLVDIFSIQTYRPEVNFEDIAILEGGHYTGADHFARDYARDNELTFINVPANWNRFNLAAGPIRNKKMADWYQPIVVVAFHDDLENSKGTKNMVNYAISRKIPVLHVTQNTWRRIT